MISRGQRGGDRSQGVVEGIRGAVGGDRGGSGGRSGDQIWKGE